MTLWKKLRQPVVRLAFGGVATILLIVIIITLVLPSRKAEAAWLSSNYGYRQQITISHTMVNSTTQTNFPVLISTTSDTNLKSVGNGGDVALTSGNDITFTASDGVTSLNYEIENYVPTTGEIEAWVDIPSLSNTTDTTIYMYYGYASAGSNGTVSAVWSNAGYKDVWHMAQTSSPLTDSIGSGVSTTSVGSPTYNSASKIDGGWNDGTAGSYFNATTSGCSPTTLPTCGTTNFSLSGWMDFNSATIGAYPALGGRATSSSWADGWGIFYNGSKLQFYLDSYSAHVATISFTDIGTGAGWHYVVGTYNGTTAKIYVDGVEGTDLTYTTTPTNGGTFELGAIGAYTGDNAGNIDEVRLASAALTTSWIDTEYNNQNSPGTYLTFGSLQALPSAPTTSLPLNGAVGVSFNPVLNFSSIATPNTDYLRYKVMIYTDNGSQHTGSCTGTLVETGDQTSGQTGFSGQDAQTSTAYNSGTTAVYTVQTTLTAGNTYCWQAEATDPTLSTNFGPLSSPTTFTINSSPAAPTLNNPASSASNISTLPQFSLRATDPDSDYLEYKIVLYASDCASAPPPYGSVQTFDSSTPSGWEGQDANSGANYKGSATITSSSMATYQLSGTPLLANHTYCWKGAAKDPAGSGAFGSYSSTQTFSTATSEVQVEGNVNIDGNVSN